MKDVPFRFGLERVRELREHDESRAREEFAASLHQRVRGVAMLHAAAEMVERARDTRRGTPSDAGLTGQDLVAHHMWLERVERERQSAELHLARQDAEVDARRQALANASMRREVLERLKERRRQEHVREGERRDGAALDEIALSGHLRRGTHR